METEVPTNPVLLLYCNTGPAPTPFPVKSLDKRGGSSSNALQLRLNLRLSQNHEKELVGSAHPT